jgi:hypothetical protein
LSGGGTVYIGFIGLGGLQGDGHCEHEKNEGSGDESGFGFFLELNG